MRALAIDTSTELAQVALCDGPSCAARTPTANAAAAAPGQHGERLLGLVDGVLAEAGWNKNDLELVACCIGPGSFTGVRVGVATAKGIALALGLPIIGVGSLEVMAHAHFTRRPASPDDAAIALLDARKGEVFWAAYERSGALLAGPGHVAASQVVELPHRVARANITFIGEIAGRLSLDPARVATAPESDRPDPVQLARLALATFERRGADDLDALEPAYVRPPDITLPGSPS